MIFCELIIKSASRSDDAKNQQCLCLRLISHSLQFMATKGQKMNSKRIIMINTASR